MKAKKASFFIWTEDEVIEDPGPRRRPRVFNYCYDVTPARKLGRTTRSSTVPNPDEQAAKVLGLTSAAPELDDDSLALPSEAVYRARSGASHPARDDKVLVAWNGSDDFAAMAQAALVIERSEIRCGRPRRPPTFILQNMRDERRPAADTVTRTAARRINAFLDDYACLIEGID